MCRRVKVKTPSYDRARNLHERASFLKLISALLNLLLFGFKVWFIRWLSAVKETCGINSEVFEQEKQAKPTGDARLWSKVRSWLTTDCLSSSTLSGSLILKSGVKRKEEDVTWEKSVCDSQRDCLEDSETHLKSVTPDLEMFWIPRRLSMPQS